MSAPHTKTGTQILELLAAASPDELNDAMLATQRSDDIPAVLVHKEDLAAMDIDARWLRGYMEGIGASEEPAQRIWDTERLRQP